MNGARAERPFVDRPVTDRAAAGRVAERQATEWGLGPPTLLRHGMNSLYVADGVVLRIGSASAPAAAAHGLVRWLLAEGVPTVSPVDGLTADVDGFAVTGWHVVRETRRAIDWRAIGAAVRRVHSLPVGDVPADYPVPPPTAFPWWRFDVLLDDVGPDLDPGARSGLQAAIDRHRDWEHAVMRDPVLCHGDVHPGNVLSAATGPLLVDWDLLCVANPAWDHAMLTTLAERWGGDARVERDFAAGYGASFAADPLARGLGELRNVAATLLRVRAGRHDADAAAEAARRLAYWRGESDTPWRAQ